MTSLAFREAKHTKNAVMTLTRY